MVWIRAGHHHRLLPAAGGGRLSTRQVQRRLDLSQELVTPHVEGVLAVTAEGTSPLARILDLVLLGDYASIYLALLKDMDPGPVEMIERLKEKLAVTPHGRAQGGSTG